MQSPELREIREALAAHFRETGNRPSSIPELVAAVAARGVRLPAGPQDGTWWAEQRVRRALGAPGYVPVGWENGRKVWAMAPRGDGPAPAKIVVRPHIPGAEGEAP